MPIWSQLDPRKPSGVPDRETIEHLLNYANVQKPRSRTLRELTEGELKDDHLVEHNTSVKLGELPGDPFGQKVQGNGNVSHQKDPRAEEVLNSIFEEFQLLEISTSPELDRYTEFFKKVYGTKDVVAVAKEVANDGTVVVPATSANETNVQFMLGQKTVYVRQCWDLDLKASNSTQFHNNPRAKDVWQRIKLAMKEEPMDKVTLRYLVAMRLCQGLPLPTTSDRSRMRQHDSEYRDACETAFWIESIGHCISTRNAIRELARRLVEHPDEFQDEDTREAFPSQFFEHWQAAEAFIARNKNWLSSIDTSGATTADKRHWDMYFANKHAAEAGVFEHLDKDIVIVLDKKGATLFANFERLLQTLYGPKAEELLDRAHNAWAWFFNVTASNGGRHVTDPWVRATQPETDIGRGKVHELANRKMCVGHYGCNCEIGWSHAPPKLTFPRLGGKDHPDDAKQKRMLPAYFKAVLGMVQEVMRFFSRHLDPVLYAYNLETNVTIPEDAKMNMSGEDFLSYVAIASDCRTNQHRDGRDQEHGFAHVMTYGDYTGGNFVVPELGVSVPYRSGALGMIRGRELNHWVTDFIGERNFIVATNKPEVGSWHERVKHLATAADREAFRKEVLAKIDADKNSKRDLKRKATDNGEGPSKAPKHQVS